MLTSKQDGIKELTVNGTKTKLEFQNQKMLTGIFITKIQVKM